MESGGREALGRRTCTLICTLSQICTLENPGEPRQSWLSFFHGPFAVVAFLLSRTVPDDFMLSGKFLL